jgi:hypothetical protein
MLRYPISNPARINVLVHAYLVLGNGVEWTRKGIIDDPHDSFLKDKNLEMHYDDLDRPYFPASKTLSAGLRAQLEKMYAESYAKDRRDREERAANIDELASTPDTTTVLTGKLMHYDAPKEVIHFLTGDYACKLAKMPKNVEPSFKAGGLEVLDAVIRGARQEHAKEEDVLTTLYALRERIVAIPTREALLDVS